MPRAVSVARCAVAIIWSLGAAGIGIVQVPDWRAGSHHGPMKFSMKNAGATIDHAAPEALTASSAGTLLSKWGMPVLRSASATDVSTMRPTWAVLSAAIN